MLLLQEINYGKVTTHFYNNYYLISSYAILERKKIGYEFGKYSEYLKLII